MFGIPWHPPTHPTIYLAPIKRSLGTTILFKEQKKKVFLSRMISFYCLVVKEMSAVKSFQIWKLNQLPLKQFPPNLKYLL